MPSQFLWEAQVAPILVLRKLNDIWRAGEAMACLSSRSGLLVSTVTCLWGKLGKLDGPNQHSGVCQNGETPNMGGFPCGFNLNRASPHASIKRQSLLLLSTEHRFDSIYGKSSDRVFDGHPSNGGK